MNTIQWFDPLESAAFLDFGLDPGFESDHSIGCCRAGNSDPWRASACHAAPPRLVPCICRCAGLAALMVLIPPLHVAMIPRPLPRSDASIDVDQNRVGSLGLIILFNLATVTLQI